jgi:hypothetical protein
MRTSLKRKARPTDERRKVGPFEVEFAGLARYSKHRGTRTGNGAWGCSALDDIDLKAGEVIVMTCKACGGDGKCKHCHGSGWVTSYKSRGGTSKCPVCDNTGKCPACKGTGKQAPPAEQ